MNEGNIFREFLFSRLRLTREIRENKNPAKISTYTVCFQSDSLFSILLKNSIFSKTSYKNIAPKML